MSTAKLIIIRGNSGSGKTTLAKALQHHYGRRTLVVSQDQVRRDMLFEHMTPNNLSIDLMKRIVLYGFSHGLTIILEGFLEKYVHEDMLYELKDMFNGKVVCCYYDISFEETVKRHQTRAKRHDFTQHDMKRWWIEKDYLGWDNEVYLNECSLEDNMTHICQLVDNL